MVGNVPHHAPEPSSRDGQPAFLHLRDWYAGMALAGLLAANSEGTSTVAEKAFEVADKMLAARAAENRG